MNDYYATIVTVTFDEKGVFEDVLDVKCADSYEESMGIVMDDIGRLIEDFDNDHVEVSSIRTNYDYPIYQAKYDAGYISYYVFFPKGYPDEKKKDE